MASTLALNGITLPVGLAWLERGSWQPIRHSTERLMGGREHTQHSSLVGGRPITLAAVPLAGGWQGNMRQSVADQLEALAHVPGGTYTLQINSDTYTVMFRHEEPPAFSYEPVIKRLTPAPTDWVLPTIKLKTI